MLHFGLRSGALRLAMATASVIVAFAPLVTSTQPTYAQQTPPTMGYGPGGSTAAQSTTTATGAYGMFGQAAAYPMAAMNSSASICPYDSQASATLDIIHQAFDDLTTMYFKPFTPSTALIPARDATHTALGAKAATTSISDWTSFKTDFCSTWNTSGLHPDTSVSHAVVQAMLGAMNEPHTEFYPPEDYQDHLRSQAGGPNYAGIGAIFGDGVPVIRRVISGSPAEQAGLAPGDRIVAVNGQSIEGQKAADATKAIRGDAGTSVQLTVVRSSGDQVIVDVRRAEIRIPPTETKSLGDIAYLRIEDFSSAVIPDRVRSALDLFRSQSAKALIIDLRGNPGGRLDIGAKVAGYLLPDGAPIYQMTGQSGTFNTVSSSGPRVWDKPVDILVDDATASMSEILAAALREDTGATVVGTNTAGAVAASVILPLTDGSAVQITTQRIDSARGAVLNNVGLRPDIQVGPNVVNGTAATDDQAISLAIANLQSKMSQ